MSTFDPRDGSHDDGILATVLEHIEQPMRTTVALRQITIQGLDGSASAIFYASQACEEVLYELVTGALALMTSSWAVATGNDIIADRDQPATDRWMTGVLVRAMTAAHARYHELIVEYEQEVGDMPTFQEGHIHD